MSLNFLQFRILELSYKHSLSHIGSSLGCAAILDEIYSRRKSDDPVILSCGHGGLGLYCVLEKHCGKNAEDLLLRHGVHPNRNLEDGIDCSTGSLGLGICIAVGRALANRERGVWCVISDGEIMEGSCLEALVFARRAHLSNLEIYLHANGYSACREVSWEESVDLAWYLYPEIQVRAMYPGDHKLPFLQGLDAHYMKMSEDDWAWVKEQEIST